MLSRGKGITRKIFFRKQNLFFKTNTGMRKDALRMLMHGYVFNIIIV